jgi:ribosome recycling factor
MNEKNKIYDDKMTKTINNLDGELATIRAGRANPHVLDKLAVDYYGTPAGSECICTGSTYDPDPAMGEEHAQGN